MKKIILSIAMLIICSLNLFVLPAFADNEFNIIGEYSNRFILTADNTYIFHHSGGKPGDIWTTEINITNKSNDKMDISLIEIVNNREDVAIPTEFFLQLYCDGVELYNGTYDVNLNPVIPTLTLIAGESKRVIAKSGISPMADNSIQNEKLDTTWIFESRLYKDNKTVSATSKTSTGKSSGIIAKKPYSNNVYKVICYDEFGNVLLNSSLSASEINMFLVEAPYIENYESTQKYMPIMTYTPDNTIVFTYRKIEDDADLGEETDNLNLEQSKEGVVLNNRVNISSHSGKETSKKPSFGCYIGTAISDLNKMLNVTKNNSICLDNDLQGTEFSGNNNHENKSTGNSSDKKTELNEYSEPLIDLSSNTMLISWGLIMVIILVIFIFFYIKNKVCPKKK